MDNLRAYPIYLGIRGSFAFFFTLWATVAAVYRIEVVHLDPLRLGLLGTALEVAVFLFEVPTGVIADTYGRRRSVITGCILMGCGFALDGGRSPRQGPGKGVPARRAGGLHRRLHRHPHGRVARSRRVEPAAHRRR